MPVFSWHSFTNCSSVMPASWLPGPGGLSSKLSTHEWPRSWITGTGSWTGAAVIGAGAARSGRQLRIEIMFGSATDSGCDPARSLRRAAAGRRVGRRREADRRADWGADSKSGVSWGYLVGIARLRAGPRTGDRGNLGSPAGHVKGQEADFGAPGRAGDDPLGRGFPPSEQFFRRRVTLSRPLLVRATLVAGGRGGDEGGRAGAAGARGAPPGARGPAVVPRSAGGGASPCRRARCPCDAPAPTRTRAEDSRELRAPAARRAGTAPDSGRSRATATERPRFRCPSRRASASSLPAFPESPPEPRSPSCPSPSPESSTSCRSSPSR